jgi:hypothetical protein
MVATALCLRAVFTPTSNIQRAIWLTLGALGKPTQTVLLVQELMVHAWGEWGRRWRWHTILLLPGLTLTIVWIVAISADVAGWRVLDGTHARELDPIWKINFIVQHPFHFPRVLWASLDQIPK